MLDGISYSWNVHFQSWVQIFFPAAASNGGPADRQRKVDSEEAFWSHEKSHRPQPDLLPSGEHDNKQWSHIQCDIINVPQAIPDTPFTLGVALPTQYELARVVGGTEVTMDALEGKQQQGHLWTWVRCIKW